MKTEATRQEREGDLLVIGSGAAGLSAAISAADRGLRVIVIEKEPLIGGATARSGGGLWIPGNHHARDRGIVDTRAAAFTYIKHLAAARFDEAKVNAFLDYGPKMVDFMETKTRVRFEFYDG